MIKAIFFDTSDTLYYSPEFKKAQKEKIILQLSERKNISFEDALALFQSTKTSLQEKMDHVNKVSVMMELGISRRDMQEFLAQLDPKKYLEPDEKLNEILHRLSSQYQLGIITNILEKFMKNILNALSIDPLHFSHIVSVDNTQKSKPDHEPFLKAVELSGIMASECLYVGDSLTKDMVPAKAVGMKTVWVSKEPDHSGHADSIIPTIYELDMALEKLK